MIHGIHKQSTAYLVVTTYLMMKFKWSFEQTFEYMLTKQPNFYLVPQFVNIVKTLEQYLILKYRNNPEEIEFKTHYVPRKQISTPTANEEAKDDEVLIWNTFINTKISAESNMQSSRKGHRPSGSTTWRTDQPDILEEGKFTSLYVRY